MKTSRLLLVSGALSLIAILGGAWVLLESDVPMSLVLRNIGGWLVGAGLAAVLMRFAGKRAAWCALGAALLLLALSFVSPGLDGVHRWVALGPLMINAAMLSLPAAAVAAASLAKSPERPAWLWLAPLGLLGLLVAQPDASQASAFGAAIIFAALASPGTGIAGKSAAVASALLVAWAWLRPDPLLPVEEVELVHRLAFEVSPPLAVAALGALILFCLSPLIAIGTGGHDRRVPAGALSLYLMVMTVMPIVGAYPVPLVGLGISPILGSWLAIGLLAAQMRRA